MEQKNQIYSQKVIEFATVVAEACLFLERASEYSKVDFISKSTKIFSLLYLKTILLDDLDEESDGFLERFVTEEDYMYVKDQIAALLGMDDSFLEVFHPDMPYSDTPIAAFISENLADVYQELKDFAANFRIGEAEVMHSALILCVETFAEHWGQKLLNALKALHALRFDGINEEEDSGFDAKEYRKLNKSSFFDFQSDDD
ncbi:MAG: DUF5063 domain-containing protein [Porphyromonadaceae bacterium]|jgi:hypothetical protein|nr:DUF5063 domain-containing protein [Porphyromonadaceae bacterium]